MDEGDVALANREKDEESALNAARAGATAVDDAAAHEESAPVTEVPAAAIVSVIDEHARLQRALSVDVLLKEKDLEIVSQIEQIEAEKKMLKGLEKEREDLIQDLREAIRGEANSDQPTLPFGEGDTVSDAIASEKSGAAAGTVEDESWRQVPLTDPIFGFSASIMNALQAADMVTAGHLSDFLKPEGRRLTDIKGIGENKAKEIEDGLTRLFARRLSSQVTEATTQPVISEPDNSTIYEPADLGFKQGMMAAACHPDLLAKSIGDRIPALRAAVKVGNRRYVPIGTVGDSEVYELRPLLLAFEKQPNTDDPHDGLQVTLDKERLMLGGKAERVMIDDGEKAPAETDPDLDSSCGGEDGE